MAVSAGLPLALAQLQNQLLGMQNSIRQLQQSQRTNGLGNSSIDNGALIVNDETGAPVLTLGLQNDGTFAITSSSATTPVAPSAPSLTAGVLELLATWNGGMFDGSAPLSDFAGVQVHCSSVEGFTPSAATVQGGLTGPGVFRVGGLTPGVTYWVALVAVNTAGNQSAPSAQASAAPLPVTSVIAAGSLTALQMGLPGGILNQNPWFAGGYGADWSGVNGTFAVVPAASAPPGVAYGNIGRYVNNGAATGRMGEIGAPFTITPGELYLVTAWVNSSSGHIAVGIEWTLAGANVSQTTTSLTITASTWTQVQTVVTAPGSGVNGGYPVVGTQTADGSTIYAVAIMVLQSIPGGVIQAGTITADQIAAGTIVAGAVDGTTITGATFDGTNWVENPNGSFYYSGPPAAGDLTASIAPSGGNDAAWTSGGGNNYSAGVYAYGASGGAAGLTVSGSEAILAMVPGGSTHITTTPNMFASNSDAGLVNETEWLIMSSGKASSNADAAVQLRSESADATISPQLIVEFGGTIAMAVGPSNTIFTTGGGITGNPAITLSDNTTDNNANLSGSNPATMQWPIPAGDAKVGTSYEIESPFSGTFETSTLAFNPTLNNSTAHTTPTSGGDMIGAAFFPSGSGFAGTIRLKVCIRTTGASGTADFFIDGGIGLNGTRSTGTNNNNGYLSSQIRGVAFNTTVSNNIAINTAWGANVSGQTISNYGSVFTRKGP